MSESDRKHVDGCAIFYKTEKYVPTIMYLLSYDLYHLLTRTYRIICK